MGHRSRKYSAARRDGEMRNVARGIQDYLLIEYRAPAASNGVGVRINASQPVVRVYSYRVLGYAKLHGRQRQRSAR